MDTGPAPFKDFADLNHRGNTVDGGVEYFGCHRPSQGYMNLKNPQAGKVYYWGAKRLLDHHYAPIGWRPARDVKAGPPLPGTPSHTPLDGTIQTPSGQGILLEMDENLARELRREKQRIAMAHMQNDGHEAFEERGYSLQEQAAYYAPRGNAGNPYQTLPGHGISATNYT